MDIKAIAKTMVYNGYHSSDNSDVKAYDLFSKELIKILEKKYNFISDIFSEMKAREIENEKEFRFNKMID